VTERRRRRRIRKQLPDGLKEKRIFRKLIEKTLDRILWGTGFRRVYEPFVKQAVLRMNGWLTLLNIVEAFATAELQTIFCSSSHVMNWADKIVTNIEIANIGICCQCETLDFFQEIVEYQ